MNRRNIISILAAAGVAYSGSLTLDAAAYARTLVMGAPEDLALFITNNPDSQFVPNALIRLAGECDSTLFEASGCYGG